LPINGQVTDFVDDEQARDGVELQFFFQPTFAGSPGQRRNHGRGGGEQHTIAGFAKWARPALGMRTAASSANRSIGR